jgi:hypothetical protein
MAVLFASVIGLACGGKKRGAPLFDDAAEAAGQSRFMSARLKESGLAILIDNAFPATFPESATVCNRDLWAMIRWRTASPKRGERPAVMDNDAFGQIPSARAELDQLGGSKGI